MVITTANGGRKRFDSTRDTLLCGRLAIFPSTSCVQPCCSHRFLSGVISAATLSLASLSLSTSIMIHFIGG
ncbi:hypothetical protein [Rhizohabitans arisaemae]|uniref:hypothetical protein n=1 Tax=Rhizohabitans arisaemae TaxID=2720610 RepID=UPI0024B0A600|nr:hypothetical protein [Rhizohabitans arisaemae]